MPFNLAAAIDIAAAKQAPEKKDSAAFGIGDTVRHKKSGFIGRVHKMYQLKNGHHLVGVHYQQTKKGQNLLVHHHSSELEKADDVQAGGPGSGRHKGSGLYGQQQKMHTLLTTRYGMAHTPGKFVQLYTGPDHTVVTTEGGGFTAFKNGTDSSQQGNGYQDLKKALG